MSEIVDICQQVRGQLRTIGLSASGIRPPGQHQAFQVWRRFVVLWKGKASFVSDLVARR